MATIRKRGNSYQIRVSCGYDTSGNQVVQTMTWKPADGMNKKQIEKELQKQAILFEDKCMKGQVTANIKFQDFAEQWFEEYAKLNLRNTSYERMKQLTVTTAPKDSLKLYKGQVKDRSRHGIKKELGNSDITLFPRMLNGDPYGN